MREMAYLPLAEDIPVAFNSCRKGPRSLGWRSDQPAELSWAEAQARTALRCSRTLRYALTHSLDPKP